MDSALKRLRNRREIHRGSDYRTQSARDRDRILYCDEFRRLGSVTQVVSVSEVHLFHNRLTHSLKVGQVGRRIAERLKETAPKLSERGGGIDPDVVESACLAHDIGHPPFGHTAEVELQQLLKDYEIDSFEGNAQSFRIVTKLAFRTRRRDQPALNLTRATLRAILKYPWQYGDHKEARYSKKWGAYRSETSSFDFAMQLGTEGVRSLEAEIMDWADDITYAVHDVEDFFKAGIIPLHLLARSDSHESNSFVDGAAERLKGEHTKSQLKTSLNRLREFGFLPTRPYGGERRSREALMDRTNIMMTRVVGATTVGRDGSLYIDADVRREIDLLKELTWQYVIENPALNTLQVGQRRVIRELFTSLNDWVSEAGGDERGRRTIPRRLDAYLLETGADPDAKRAFGGNSDLVRIRAVTDYISSLTEAQAIGLHQRLLGGTAPTALESWLAVG